MKMLLISRPIAAFALAFTLSLSPWGMHSAHAEVAEYELSRQYGSVLFRVLQEKTLYLVGRFDDFSGRMDFDPQDLAATRLDATVVMGSLNMADRNVVELLTTSAVWFNTGLFQEATFSTESARATGDDTAELEGTLTFVGVSRPWTLQVTFLGGADDSLEGSTVGMQATGSFKRSDFGLDQYMNVAADEVEIEVNVKFNRQ